ncbi:MAG TPA: efflux RND transporter periplasmic adaptor subunit [Patescibacteria group bacterium]|nr:efflux RND transporter periplasmic adaptor subunit [Patescibacteria group bacterium]
MIRKNAAIGLVLILGFAVLAGGIAGCGESGERRVEGDHDDHAHAGGDGEHDPAPVLEMTEHEMEELGIDVLVAVPGTIGRTVELPGEIVLNADRVVHIIPRVGGIVREVRKRLGDDVTEGEIMAVIESRELADATAEYLASRERRAMALTVFDREEALWQKKISSEQEFLDAKRELMEARIANRAAEQKLLALGLSTDALERLPAQPGSNLTRNEIRSPVGGTVIRKQIGLGEALGGDAEVYVVADLGTVWVDISVYQGDLPFVKPGQRVFIAVGDGAPPIEGVIDYVGPILGEETRTALARVILPNPAGRLRPGAFVTATVFLDEVNVPVVVPEDAVQDLDGEPVVFVWTGSGFEAGIVTTGRMSGGAVEIVSGLDPGQRYAAAGAFNLKAKLVTGSMDAHAGHGH